MSLAIVQTRAQSGLHSPAVTVEVHLSNGLPGLSIVGLPETAVKESKDRVRSALINSHFEFPPRRITINLAPADLPKGGGRYDLPIALGILAASGQLPANALADSEFVGELALSGELRPVTGILPASLACAKAGRKLVVCRENAAEASLNAATEVLYADHILEVCAHLHARQPLPLQSHRIPQYEDEEYPDLKDVIGQHQARRALEISAAGRHNLLFSGPPGAGKTLLASRLPGILPPLDEDSAIEVAAIYSVASQQRRGQFHQPPFRAPHHTASAVALVGGGNDSRPGEISLAHGGVLFLDELPEFPRRVLEVMREPLESGEIVIARIQAQNRYPARFQLVAAMNPCNCGFLGEERCRCTPDQVRRYRNRISGPLLDRIDLQVHVPALPHRQLTTSGSGEPSAAVRKRVIAARQRQLNRQGKLNNILIKKELDYFCRLNERQQTLMENAAQKMQLSARGFHRLLKVARTISDITGTEKIQDENLKEALSYRLTYF